MTPRNSQRKGKQGEHELAAMLTTLLGVPCQRMASAYLPGWKAPDVFGLPGIHIEVKRRERVALHAALQQARYDAMGKTPIVAHRGNGAPWLVTIQLEDLPELAKKISTIEKPSHIEIEPANAAATVETWGNDAKL